MNLGRRMGLNGDPKKMEWNGGAIDIEFNQNALNC